MNQSEGQQAAAVRQQLVQLVRTNGPELLDDARRVRAMLGDAVVGATAEANLIALAISSGVPARLRQGEGVSTIVAELQRTSSVQPRDAQWAVGSIAEALGIEASTPPVSAAPPAQAPAADDPPGPDDLVIAGAGPDVVVRAGTTATIGRDPSCTVVLNSTAISRQHVRVERTASGWELTDVGSTQGSFVGGTAVRTTLLTASTSVTLGQGAEAITLEFRPARATARPAPERARPDVRGAAPATEVPGRPGGAFGGGAPKTEVTGGDSLTVSLGGSTRVVPAGGSLTVGREADNDLLAPGSTASRHHLRIEQAGGAWKLRDLGSSAGTWIGGERVTDVTLAGTQEFVLGEPGRGDKLTTQAAGATAKPVGASTPTGGSGRKAVWLVPIAAAVAVLMVLVAVGVYVWYPEKDGNDPPARLTDDQLAQATVKLDVPGQWSGSGVIVDNELGLILTNAHVAQPQAIGQGLPLEDDTTKCGLQCAPVMSTEMLATGGPNPKALVVYVAKDRGSPALPKFWAEPVAWDGFLDVAVLKITRLYNGSDDFSTAPIAGPSNFEDLPEVPLGNSSELQSGDAIKVFGYPGVQGSQTPSLIPGTLSSAVGENRLAAKWGEQANEAIWNFSGQIEHGNSGGLAVDDETHQMVGIPTWLVPDRATGAPVYSRFRPIDFVKPVLEAAQQGKKYVSPYATPGGDADVDFLGWATNNQVGVQTCEEAQGGGDLSALVFDYKNFPGPDETTDLAVNLYSPSNGQWQLVDYAIAAVPNHMKSNGCVVFTLHEEWPEGTYAVQVGIGGDLNVIFDSRA